MGIVLSVSRQMKPTRRGSVSRLFPLKKGHNREGELYGKTDSTGDLYLRRHGGHVNPAIAVAQLVAEKNPGVEILFVGAERGLEKELVPAAGYDFRTVHISSFHRSFKPAEIKHNLVSLYNMVRSPAEAGPFSGTSGRCGHRHPAAMPAIPW